MAQIFVGILPKVAQVHFSIHKQIDTSTSAGRLMLTIFAGIAQFERECLLERQAEGIALAKREGRMGRPKAKLCDNFQVIVKEWKQGNITAVEAMKRAGMRKATFYRKIKSISDMRSKE